MRRKEFEITDRAVLEDFLQEQKTGVLSLGTRTADEFPYSVPVNFVYTNNAIAFHSAPAGKKTTYFDDGRKVQFISYREYSLIPSYFTGKADPCSATHFFKSVMVFGTLRIVGSVEEKIEWLNLLMMKLQPEGKYEPLSPAIDADKVRKLIVGKIMCEEVTGKFKFGQHLSDETAGIIAGGLTDRGTPADRATAELITRLRKQQ